MIENVTVPATALYLYAGDDRETWDTAQSSAKSLVINFLGPELAREFFGTDITDVIEHDQDTGVLGAEAVSDIVRNPVGTWQEGQDDFCESSTVATAIRYGSAYKTWDSGVDIISGAYDGGDVASVVLSETEFMAQAASKAPTFVGAGGAYTILGTTWDVFCPD